MNINIPHSLNFLHSFRLLPNFFILGAQKSGTTSLHHYLIQHPHVRMPTIKEVHFFDENFSNGINWYRKHFPTFLQKLKTQMVYQEKFLCGESTPYYLFHPLVPKRIFETCPNAKFIILLKNPIDRAYSHYQHERKRGFEPLESFELAIEAEPKRLKDEKEKIILDSSYNSFQYMHYSYLSRGHYSEQIERWFQLFSRDRFLILEAEKFSQDTLNTFKEVLIFLKIKNFENIQLKRYNSNRYQLMSEDTRKALKEYFEPYNLALNKLLDEKINWI